MAHKQNMNKNPILNKVSIIQSIQKRYVEGRLSEYRANSC